MAVAVLAVAAVASAGYGVYASERAASESADRYKTATSDMERARIQEEARLRNDKLEMEALAKAQREAQEATNLRLKGEQTAELARIKGEVPGLQAKLGADLLAQQEIAYKRLAPELENRLNALGLLQSGALAEAQAKAQGDLEARRQAALTDFGRTAAYDLSIAQPLAASSADIGRQSEALGRNLELARTNLSQQFANENTAALNEAARREYLGQLQTAQGAASQSAANAYINFGGQVGSGLLSYYGNREAQNRRQRPSSSLDALYASRDKFGYPRSIQRSPYTSTYQRYGAYPY